MALVITTGEPAGVGPDIIIQTAQSQALDAVVLSDKTLLKKRADELGLRLELVEYTGQSLSPQKGRLYVLPLSLSEAVTPGHPNPNNAAYVLAQLQMATKLCVEKTVTGMVTLPICKATINQAGESFSGHTEYLANLTHTADVVMMLAAKSMRVALVTTHLPLSQVPQAITKEKIKKTLTILLSALRNQFGVNSPSIAVAGLNPHAGEAGYLGREEIDIIEPVIKSFSDENVKGPFAADTMFTQDNCEQYDAFLAMYHDQGLSVLKYASFGEAVNITLGLPIIRTSVDHGTAFALAGTGKAKINSFLFAYQQAEEMSVCPP